MSSPKVNEFFKAWSAVFDQLTEGNPTWWAAGPSSGMNLAVKEIMRLQKIEAFVNSFFEDILTILRDNPESARKILHSIQKQSESRKRRSNM